MRYHKFVILSAVALAACANLSVVSPDGKSSATYRGTSIIGGEEVSCGTMGTVTTCSESGQNVAALAQAIAPYLGGIGGLPLPTAMPTPAPAALEAPVK